MKRDGLPPRYPVSSYSLYKTVYISTIAQFNIRLVCTYVSVYSFHTFLFKNFIIFANLYCDCFCIIIIIRRQVFLLFFYSSYFSIVLCFDISRYKIYRWYKKEYYLPYFKYYKLYYHQRRNRHHCWIIHIACILYYKVQ